MGERTLEEKQAALAEILESMGRVLVAYSGGVDSSLLVYFAHACLGKDKVLAVTADAETFTREELAFTEEFTARYGIRHKVVATCELAVINSHGNPQNRCYYCKRELFTLLQTLALEEHATVVEGSNRDDDRDYRPGSLARSELGIRSPLCEAGLGKTEIRSLSRARGLATWDKPAYACLTSRFPYNVEISAQALAMVEAAEKFLHQAGFRQCRVRHYGTKARVEVAGELVAQALAMHGRIAAALEALGYTEVEIDPAGYRMGSMNIL